MGKYVSKRYIEEKIWPIKSLISILDTAEGDSIGNEVEGLKESVVKSFAIIAKELGVKIPEV